MIQTQGIGIVAQEVSEGKELSDDRWKQFSKEEVQALIDGMYNHESGKVSNETVKNLCRSLLTESKNRETE